MKKKNRYLPPREPDKARLRRDLLLLQIKHEDFSPDFESPVRRWRK